ncbi:acyltransferase [Mucilaginibacter corticis]|uniref:Acyltransferase n=1 Tax=Mucilaginibacter corticis TaxID=2597670 RepID=A0A556MBE4_9SPHI|nr:acyltransferase [Mucilaginibacter corticis]TSJ37244.1 acyltransferase [Mucilaginibacter corticis]
MQNLPDQPKPKKNYDFIDSIRSIAMMSIVAEHCVTAGNHTYAFGSDKYWVYLAVVQLTKFGTITFFLLAGFLMGEKFADYSPAQYLRRRVSTTFGPWIFWSLLFVALVIIRMRIGDHYFDVPKILNITREIYLYSNYWFIINFLISISILLIFRRYLYSFYLGAILGAFTLFYSVNIHYEWVSPRHTTAILGFVFFLLLGAQLRKNLDYIEGVIANTSYFMVSLFVFVAFGLAIYESVQLNGHSVDPFNSLRFSNILYSLAVFTLLLKLKTFKWVSYLKPRQTTFGIYLIHFILVIFLVPKLLGHFNEPGLNPSQLIVFKLAAFLIAYIGTLSIVLFINKTPAKKLIGN